MGPRRPQRWVEPPRTASCIHAGTPACSRPAPAPASAPVSLLNTSRIALALPPEIPALSTHQQPVLCDCSAGAPRPPSILKHKPAAAAAASKPLLLLLLLPATASAAIANPVRPLLLFPRPLQPAATRAASTAREASPLHRPMPSANASSTLPLAVPIAAAFY